MPVRHLIAIAAIFACTAVGWFLLGGALAVRTSEANRQLAPALEGNWGPPLAQSHPSVHYTAPGAADAKRQIAPAASEVRVALSYQPKRKGLLRYRTYTADFSADYEIANPAPIEQTLFFEFTLPDPGLRYDGFELAVAGAATGRTPERGVVREALRLGAGETVTVAVRYRAGGLATWRYRFEGAHRIANFSLAMATDFADYDIPHGAASPAEITPAGGGDGLGLRWRYDGVINAGDIGMAMPKILNPGPVAARITFFAPVSLLFFFTVLTLVGAVRGDALHPMQFFFIAAGCFAFQLLFAYLVDLVPAAAAFAIAAAVSLALVGSYLWRAKSARLARVALVAQFAYMVLFSASFFFDGLTGITVTVGAIATLGILMALTARVDWAEVFKPKPPSNTPQPGGAPLATDPS